MLMGKLEEFREQRAVLYKRLAEMDKSIESLENAQWFFEDGENIWFVDQFGNVQCSRWGGKAWSDIAFIQGHIFKTEKEARLESQRRNLLQRFKMFRDKCNDDWEPDWRSHLDRKYYILCGVKGIRVSYVGTNNDFCLFGYFKNEEDCERALELFGDEIKELFVECE